MTEHPKLGIYGDDMSRPISELLEDIRSSLVKARGRLSDIYFAHPGLKSQVAPAEHLLTCGVVYLYHEIEEVRRREKPKEPANGECITSEEANP